MAVFSGFVFNPTVFLTAFAPAESTVGGGFDVKKYRDYLERLNGITREKITNTEVLEIQQISKAVKVKSPVVKKATREPWQEINYAAIEREVEKIRNKILVLMEQAILLERKRNQEEEAALVLLLCV